MSDDRKHAGALVLGPRRLQLHASVQRQWLVWPGGHVHLLPGQDVHVAGNLRALQPTNTINLNATHSSPKKHKKTKEPLTMR